MFSMKCSEVPTLLAVLECAGQGTHGAIDLDAVTFETLGNHLKVWATDSYIVAQTLLTLNEEAESTKFSVRASDLKKALLPLRAAKYADISFHFSKVDDMYAVESECMPSALIDTAKMLPRSIETLYKRGETQLGTSVCLRIESLQRVMKALRRIGEENLLISGSNHEKLCQLGYGRLEIAMMRTQIEGRTGLKEAVNRELDLRYQ